jgi:hypothetical protein
MITGGSVGSAALDASDGAIYVFSIDLDDCYGPEPKTNWRGKPVGAMFRSKEDQRVAFTLHVFSMVATVKTEGRLPIPHWRVCLNSILLRVGSPSRPR